MLLTTEELVQFRCDDGRYDSSLCTGVLPQHLLESMSAIPFLSAKRLGAEHPNWSTMASNIRTCETEASPANAALAYASSAQPSVRTLHKYTGALLQVPPRQWL